MRRDAQAKMSAYIADRLADGKIAIAEGGTGIGKSYAALIAALEARRCLLNTMREEDPDADLPPVVYSTGTIALQEQIVTKDLPFLANVLPYHVKFAVAKGRGRYFCPLRAEKAAGDTKTMDLFDEEQDTVSDGASSVAKELLKRFQGGDWDGDLDALPSPLSPDAASAVTISGAACQKRQCKFYDECPFFLARKHLRTMDVIVVNHDLLLCDIKAGGGRVLPGKPEQTLYLIDEAHQFPDKAVNQLGGRAHLSAIKERAGSIAKAINHAQRIMLSMPDSIKAHFEQVGSCIKPIVDAADETEQILQHNMEDQQWLMENGCSPLLAEPVKRLDRALSDMCAQLEKLVSELKDHQSMDKSRIEFAFHLSIMAEYSDAVAMFLADDPESAPPTARWAEFGEKGFSLNAFPTFPSHRLATMFWDRVLGAACFSATLRSLGSFDKFKKDTGIALVGRSDEGMVSESDFDYRRSGLYLLANGPSPNARHADEQDEYRRMVCQMIGRAITSENYLGVLVIFTSRTFMDEIYAMLEGEGMPGTESVLRQGDMRRAAIIEEHRRRIESGQKSVIFGLASFREGVDLPGELCSCVIIPRLPFAVPTTPMEKARVDWLKKAGRNPFMDYALPACSTWLTQMVGRLIRTHQDTGIVLILDNRIVKARYGHLLLKNLPPFPVSHIRL